MFIGKPQTKVKRKENNNVPVVGAGRSEEMRGGKPPAQFISCAHIQLELGDVTRRHHSAEIKSGPEGTGRTLRTGGLAGNHQAEGIQPLQLAAAVTAAAVKVEAEEAAKDPRAGGDWWVSKRPAGRLATATVAAALIRGNGGCSSRSEVELGGGERDPGWGESTGPDPKGA